MITTDDIEFFSPVKDENGNVRIKAVLNLEATYQFTQDDQTPEDIEKMVKDILTDAIMGYVYPEK